MTTERSNNKHLSAGVMLDQYCIKKVLGEGGFGVTYLAKDTMLGRDVVIKENFPQMYASRDHSSGTVMPLHTSKQGLYNKFLQDFINEAKMLARLNHPNIVQILATIEQNDTAYFVMPYVSSYNLHEYIYQEGKIRIREEQCVALLQTLLKTLRYLHGHKIYHRDIKPANILIDPAGHPVLIDFGAARELDGSQTVTVIASFGFSSPEQMIGMKNEQGPWTDIYALAATMYIILTGVNPQRGDTRLFQDELIPLHKRTDLHAHYSPGLLKSIDKALCPDWKHRYQSAEEWIEDIKNIQNSNIITTCLKKIKDTARSKPSKRVTKVATGIALISSLLLGFSLWNNHTSDEAPVQKLLTKAKPVTGKLVEPTPTPPPPLLENTPAHNPSATKHFAGGHGTADSPFIIKTKDQLNNLRLQLNSHFKLTEDIVFTSKDFLIGGAFYNDGTAWEPIGSLQEPFTGHLDGNGHTIVGLQCLPSTNTNAGLFGCTKKAYIQSLSLENCTVNVNNPPQQSPGIRTAAAILIAQALATNVNAICIKDSEVSIKSDLWNASYVGTLIGETVDSPDEPSPSTITNCIIHHCSVKNGHFTGGLIGNQMNASINKCFVNHSELLGYYTGGIVGVQGSKSSIKNVAFLNGEIFLTNPKATGFFIGGTYNSELSKGNKLFVCDNSKLLGKTATLETESDITAITNNATFSDLWSKLEPATDKEAKTTWSFNTDCYPQLCFQKTPIPITAPKITPIIVAPTPITPTQPETPAPIISSPDGEKYFAGGDGTATSPFLVSNTEQLDNVRKFLAAHFKLKNHIVFNNKDFKEKGKFYNNGNAWIPIGGYPSLDQAFTGTFNGDGYSISGLICTPHGTAVAGLFGVTLKATIHNLLLKNVTVELNNPQSSPSNANNKINMYAAGALVGSAESSVISNICVLNANLSCTHIYYSCVHLGGIIGRTTGDNTNKTSIKNCCTIKSSMYNAYFAGGLVGDLIFCDLGYCYAAKNKVEGTSPSGIAGIQGERSTIKNVAVIDSQLIGTGNPPNGKFIGGTYRSSQNHSDNLFVCNKSRADGKTIQEQSDPNITEIPGDSSSSSLWKQLDFNIGEDESSDWTHKEGSLPSLTSMAKQEALATKESPKIFKQGTGIDIDPFIIDNKEQLQAMKEHTEAFFKLNAHITFSAEDFAKGGAFFNDGKGWQPIGTEEQPFTGSFDGSGFIIKNLQMKANTYLDPIGFFGVTKGATIENVTLSCNFSYSSPYCLDHVIMLGGLIGHAENSIVKNAKIAAKIFFQTEAKQNSAVGILIGKAENSHIEQSQVLASLLQSAITASPTKPANNASYLGIYFGGLIGSMHYSKIIESSVAANIRFNCNFKLDANPIFIGGMIGSANKVSKIDRCTVTGKIEGSINSSTNGGKNENATSSGAHSIGGMLALLDDSQLSNSIASNILDINIETNEKTNLAGMIAHLQDSKVSQIIVNNPSLKVKINDYNNSHMGALVGKLTKSKSTTTEVSGAILLDIMDIINSTDKQSLAHLSHAAGSYTNDEQDYYYNIQCLVSAPLIAKMQTLSRQRDAARAWRKNLFHSTNPISSLSKDSSQWYKLKFIISQEVDPKNIPQKTWADMGFKFGTTPDSPWIWEGSDKTPSLYRTKQ